MLIAQLDLDIHDVAPGVDPEFSNRGARTCERVGMMEYSIVKLYFNSCTHTYSRHFRSIHELILSKYWHRRKYRALKKFTSKNRGVLSPPLNPPLSTPHQQITNLF